MLPRKKTFTGNIVLTHQKAIVLIYLLEVVGLDAQPAR